VVVIDGVSPHTIGPGRFVLVNTVPGDVPLERLGTVEQPTIMDWDRHHPILRFVDLSKVRVEEALRVRPVAPGRTLIDTGSGPLTYLPEESQRKAVFVGFDLFKTDLPLRVAFPLILSNSLRWLHPVGLEGADLMAKAGTPFLLPLEHGVEWASIRDPEGRTREVSITRGVVSFAQTDRVGPTPSSPSAARCPSPSTSSTPRRRVYRRCQGQVGGPLALLAGLQQVLGPNRPLDAPRGHAERRDGPGRAARRPRHRDRRGD